MEAGAMAAVLKAAQGTRLARLAKERGEQFVDGLIAKHSNVFSDHVRTTKRRVSEVKNLIYRDRARDLIDQYVEQRFGMDRMSLSEARVYEMIRSGSSLVISGTAGSGKSMFAKRLALRLIDDLRITGIIPLFLELRDLNGEPEGMPIEQYLFSKCSSSSSPATFEFFEAGLRNGLFVLIFDGVDEVDPSKKEKIIRQIVDMPRKYHQTSIVITTRPDRKIEHANSTTTLKIEAFYRDQLFEFVDKLDFHLETKKLFKEKITTEYFAEYKEYLSNPLLATIMLLSFNQYADAPMRYVNFYRQAFEALYILHDVTKGVYTRRHECGLEIDQFCNALSAFSFMTLSEGKLKFSETELVTYSRKAIEIFSLSADPSAFAEDLVGSSCILVRDGLETTFIHRTFQEYFASYFVDVFEIENKAPLISKLASRKNDISLDLLFEANPDLVKAQWYGPLLKSAYGIVDDIDLKEGDLEEALSRFISSVMFDDRGIVVEVRPASHAKVFELVMEGAAAVGHEKLSRLIDDLYSDGRAWNPEIARTLTEFCEWLRDSEETNYSNEEIEYLEYYSGEVVEVEEIFWMDEFPMAELAMEIIRELRDVSRKVESEINQRKHSVISALGI